MLIGVGTIISTFLLSVPIFAQEDFHDEWTAEIRASFETCKGRMPERVTGEDMKFAITQHDWYIKYMDQITFFRMVNNILDPSGKETLKSALCLFEFPCFTMSPVLQLNNTISTCTGSSFRSINRMRPDGIVEAQALKPNDAADFKFLVVPAYTDRKSFVVNILCLQDGALGFVVASNRPELSAVSRHLIKDFLDSSGFRDSFRLTTTYDSGTCKNKIEKAILSPEALLQLIRQFNLTSL